MLFPRRCALTILVLLSGTAALAATAKKQSTRPQAEYKGAIVVDAATGNILFEDRADTVTPPASMTKLMTFAVLHDRMANGSLTLQTPVKIEPSDSKIGGTQVFLDPRETFSVEELIYAMMIQSANDAAHALARAGAGSVAAFVELMNAKAGELGMKQTKFRTPHGLPPSNRKVDDGDLTTARDFALLCRHLVTKTNVLQFTAVPVREFGPNRRQPQKMENHNKLLGKVAGVDGLKTGYTSAAGYCLSATAQRNGRRVIVVILGSLGPNGEVDRGRARDLKTVELLERGFAALPPAPQPRPTAASDSIVPAPRPVQPAAAAPTVPSDTQASQPIRLRIPKK